MKCFVFEFYQGRQGRQESTNHNARFAEVYNNFVWLYTIVYQAPLTK